MTITASKLAKLLQVSKPTIIKAAKERLNMQPNEITKRYEFDYAAVEQLAKIIRPNDFIGILQSAEIAEIAKSGTEKGVNIERDAVNSEKSTVNSGNTVNDGGNSEKLLIDLLQKALEDKENTIRAQQNQIDMLIKSNAMLTARLEDKSNADAAAVDLQPMQKRPGLFSAVARWFHGGSRHPQ